MRNRPSIQIASVMTTALAVCAIVLSNCHGRPRIDRDVHVAIGKALAKETLELLPPNGEVTVITRDTESYPQPALDIALESFRDELRSSKARITSVHKIQTDPIRPTDVPSGYFFEWIRRASGSRVIVSFLGPPLLTEAQRSRLGDARPKIVCFCPGALGDAIDLAQLFQAGLLHAAVVSQPTSPPAETKSSVQRDDFDQLYRVVRAKDPPSAPGASVSFIPEKP